MLPGVSAARAAFPGKLQLREWSNGESSCSRLAGWCSSSRAAARSVLGGRSPEMLDTGWRPNKVKACARPTDPGDERVHGARSTRSSAASNDRTSTSLSSCSVLPLPLLVANGSCQATSDLIRCYFIPVLQSPVCSQNYSEIRSQGWPGRLQSDFKEV